MYFFNIVFPRYLLFLINIVSKMTYMCSQHFDIKVWPGLSLRNSLSSKSSDRNILYPLQHGFRTGRSCEAQLLEFIEYVTLNMENGKQTDILQS